MAKAIVAEAGIESSVMVQRRSPDGDRPRRADRDGVIEIVFDWGARVRLRGQVNLETLRQVIKLLR